MEPIGEGINDGRANQKGTGKTGMTREQYIASVRKDPATKARPGRKPKSSTPSQASPSAEPAATRSRPAGPAAAQMDPVAASAVMAEILRRAGYQVAAPGSPPLTPTAPAETREQTKARLDAQLAADVAARPVRAPIAPLNSMEALHDAISEPMQPQQVVHAARCASRGTDSRGGPMRCDCAVSPGQYPVRTAPMAIALPEPPQQQFCRHGLPTIGKNNGCQHEPLEEDLLAEEAAFDAAGQIGPSPSQRLKVAMVSFDPQKQPYVAGGRQSILRPSKQIDVFLDPALQSVVVIFKPTGGKFQTTIVPLTFCNSVQLE